MKKKYTAILYTALSLSLLAPVSCVYNPLEYFNRSESVNDRASEIRELEDSSLGSSYDIVVLSDIHFGQDRADRHDDDVVDWLESLGTKPKFCVNLGDTADHGKEGEFDDWLELKDRIEGKIPGPVYSIIGNHDLRSDGWEHFHSKLYPYTSSYHFSTGGMSYYFLDNADGTLGKKQMKNLEDAFGSDSKPKVIFMHCPIYHDKANLLSATSFQDTHEADKLLSLFAKNRVQLILVGHSHAFRKNDFGSFTEFNLPSYVHSRAWGLIHIDENAGTATPELISN